MQYYYKALTFFAGKKALYLRQQLFYSEICNSHFIYSYKRKAEIIYGIIIRTKIIWSHSRKLKFFLRHI